MLTSKARETSKPARPWMRGIDRIPAADLKAVMDRSGEFPPEDLERARERFIAEGCPSTEATYYAVLRLLLDSTEK